jgi:outer membrane protein assembly factor BamB
MDKFSSSGHIACGSSRVWVSNSYSSTITELDASTGSLVRVISGKIYKFKLPGQILINNGNVWVINLNGDSLTELNASNGKLIRVVDLHSGHVTASQYYGPLSMAVSGDRILVTNISSVADSIIELNAITGSLIRVINRGNSTPNSNYGQIATVNSHIWVTNSNGDSLTEVNVGSGAVIRNIEAHAEDLNGTEGLAVSHSLLLVTNSIGKSVTELNANDGSLIRVIQLKSSNDIPGPIVTINSRAWILNTLGSVIELNTTNGAIIRYIN